MSGSDKINICSGGGRLKSSHQCSEIPVWKFKAIICLLFSLVFFSGDINAETVVSPVGLKEHSYKLVEEFSDEFSGESLDQSKWTTNVYSWGQWSWSSDNVSVGNGSLLVRMDYDPHQRNDRTISYRSGIIKSVKSDGVLYGYFEIRMKGAPLHPGVCPAFWGYRDDGIIWSEIDFVELTSRQSNPRYIDHYAHLFRRDGELLSPPDRVGGSITADWDPRDDYHVYGLEWRSDLLSWYVDGDLVRQEKNSMWHYPIDVVVSLGLRKPLKETADKKGFPVHFEVDYVRVWK